MRLHQQYNSWDNRKDPERPLIIGYVSPDYFTHSVSYFIEAPLVFHDYANYKVVVYSAVVKVLLFAIDLFFPRKFRTVNITHLCFSILRSLYAPFHASLGCYFGTCLTS